MSWPEVEIDVTASLVERLLKDQHPDLAGLSITAVGFGYDNSI
jgi:hypothetical protein